MLLREGCTGWGMRQPSHLDHLCKKTTWGQDHIPRSPFLGSWHGNQHPTNAYASEPPNPRHLLFEGASLVALFKVASIGSSATGSGDSTNSGGGSKRYSVSYTLGPSGTGGTALALLLHFLNDKNAEGGTGCRIRRIICATTWVRTKTLMASARTHATVFVVITGTPTATALSCCAKRNRPPHASNQRGTFGWDRGWRH